MLPYERLLALFWASHQPQRAPWRPQYMAAAFPTAAQRDVAEASRARIAAEKKITVETPVLAGARFYLAEDYHQKYYLRHDATLMPELAALSPHAFVESPVAARLNGYVAGHGTPGQLADELPAFGLSERASSYLIKRVAGRRR